MSAHSKRFAHRPEKHVKGHPVAHVLRILSVPIILAWIAIAVLVNVIAPQLEVVGEEHSAPMTPNDAPSVQAMKEMGANFTEFDSNSTVMVIVEGQQPLGPDAHQYYDAIIAKLRRDPEHIQHIQDFWGDTLTAAGAQSSDGKAAYVMLNLAGEQGQTLSNTGVEHVREAIADTPAPQGVQAYVAGPAALTDDMHVIGNASLGQITLYTLLAIFFMLLVVYRSLVTTLVQLFLTAIGLLTARGVVSVLADNGAFGLTTFAGNILTMLAIAAATDYGIFIFGRYREARSAGEDRETAYHTTFRSVTPVIIGSGLTIAGATYCLSFARLPYFSTMGEPVAIGMVVVVASAVTLGPAVLFLGSKIRLFESKRDARSRFWRRVGTAVVRWPGPILVASAFVVLIGLVAIPGYKPAYNDRYYLPDSAQVNVGYAAADRHFTPARMNPDIIMVEADHDMRNPGDMLVLNAIGRNVMQARGIAMVQSITRPLGIPIQHSSIPFQTSVSGQVQNQNLPFQQAQLDNMKKMAEATQANIDIMEKQYQLSLKQTQLTQDSAQKSKELLQITEQVRDNIANFDDQFRPLRNYFYWEPHCFDIPMCAALRSVFDSLDGISELADKFNAITASLDKLDALQPQLVALLPPQIAIQERNRELTLSNYATTGGTNNQSQEALVNATAMGKAFDDAKNDDSFYLPPEAFDNPDFKRGLKLFLSPDGKAARMIVTHQGNPADPEGIPHIDAIKDAAFDALKATPMSDAKIYVAGLASTNKDIQEGMTYDLLISALAALALILLVMMFITRSIVAAIVIVGTVALSLGASVGLSVLLWQYIFGIHLFWIVVPLAIILLLAVGADYNLLLISRFEEEMHAGLRTGIIRAMAGTGRVVTAAGLVFAATMSSFIFSDLVVLGQIGTTIGLGLLFDTLVVRSFMTPAIAALLGRWFWWPLNVRPSPASRMFRPYGTRTAVRELLHLDERKRDTPTATAES